MTQTLFRPVANTNAGSLGTSTRCLPASFDTAWLYLDSLAERARGPARRLRVPRRDHKTVSTRAQGNVDRAPSVVYSTATVPPLYDAAAAAAGLQSGRMETIFSSSRLDRVTRFAAKNRSGRW